jgi:hypothetical protein
MKNFFNFEGILQRRKGLQNAYSSVNLTTPGQDEISSSEESPPPMSSNSKPAVPPRPRNIPPDQRRVVQIVNSKAATELPCKDSDIENADLTSQLCSNIINQLIQTTNSVIHLHQRLRINDESSSSGMLKELENAVTCCQTMLLKINR